MPESLVVEDDRVGVVGPERVVILWVGRVEVVIVEIVGSGRVDRGVISRWIDDELRVVQVVMG